MKKDAPTNQLFAQQETLRVSAAISHWTQLRAHAFTQFEQKRRVTALWKSLSDATDGLIKQIMGDAAVPFVVCAVGGYGRGQLFPFSDIDVLIITSEAKPPDASIEQLLYGLWDLPLKVGHAVRTIKETIALSHSDHTICASMMDLRFIAGDKALYQMLLRHMNKEVRAKQTLWFVEEKLRERDTRHKRALDSRFVLEPNVKEGKGALRDLHTIWWLARYCYNVKHIADLSRGTLFTVRDAQDYSHALMHLATVRASLHLLAARAEDRLTFDAQLKLSEIYAYRKSGEEAAARFMKHYFHHATRVGELTRSFCTLLEEENKRTPHTRISSWFTAARKLGVFEIVSGRLLASSVAIFRHDPLQMVEIFALAQQHGFDIHPTSLAYMAQSLVLIDRKIRGLPRASALLKQILLSPNNPEATLRRMSEAGVLQRILPEFSAITGQMQYDRYHTYTVDEHTLKAIGFLTALEQGQMRESIPLASDIIGHIASRTALYMAMLTHDIGKGVGKQAERGEELAAEIARRMHCTKAEIETIAWLVRNHLLMSEVAFKRDLDDPKTVQDFVGAVQSIERLRLLLLITVADIHAVGPKIWNGWKGALLRDLYHRAHAIMGGGEIHYARYEQHPSQSMSIIRENSAIDWPDNEREYFITQSAPTAFWQRSAADQQMLIALYRDYQQSLRPQIFAHSNTFHAICEVTLCTVMTPSLLRTVAGASALMGASIVSAKWLVSRDDVAWLSVGLQDITGQAFSVKKVMTELLPLLHKVSEDELNLHTAMLHQQPSTRIKRALFDAPARVMIDNAGSATHSIIEVNGQDRIGLLHDIAAALEQEKLVVATAHVATYAQRVVDVFYVKDRYGHKLYHPSKCDEVKRRVMHALGDNEKEK